MLRSALCLLLLSACGAGACDAGGLAAGEIEARVNGEAWQGSAATWSTMGGSVQVASAAAGGWWLSAVVQETVDGALFGDTLAAADLPAIVDLVPDGTFGWATFYPEDGDSYSTKQSSGGSLTLDELQGTGVLGCFAFTAANADGDEVVVKSGRFHAVAR